VFYAVCVVLLSAVPLLAQPVAYVPEDEREIVRLVNQERQSLGLPALALDERLTQAARKHSTRMAATGEVEHEIAGEAGLSLRLGAVRFDSCGENVALAENAARVHAGLMHSSGHRANILDSQFNSIGVGVVRTEEGIYVTQDFARRLPDASVDEAEAQVVANLNRLRRSVGMPILNRTSVPELRKRACAMAAYDRVNPAAGLLSRNVSNSVAFTAVDLSHVPEALQQLKTQKASALSVGACYQSSASYKNPVFWVIVVTYF